MGLTCALSMVGPWRPEASAVADTSTRQSLPGGNTLLAKHCQSFSHARCPVLKSGYHNRAVSAAYDADSPGPR